MIKTIDICGRQVQGPNGLGFRCKLPIGHEGAHDGMYLNVAIDAEGCRHLRVGVNNRGVIDPYLYCLPCRKSWYSHDTCDFSDPDAEEAQLRAELRAKLGLPTTGALSDTDAVRLDKELRDGLARRAAAQEDEEMKRLYKELGEMRAKYRDEAPPVPPPPPLAVLDLAGAVPRVEAPDPVAEAFAEVHARPANESDPDLEELAHLTDRRVAWEAPRSPAPPAGKHDHPTHYGGKDNPYEAIQVIEAWGAGFCGGNALKYICRAGKKNGETVLDDLKKAKWYLARAVDQEHRLCDGAPTSTCTDSDGNTVDYTPERVAAAWVLSEDLLACIEAIGRSEGLRALRHLDDHIIMLLETKKEIPAP